MKVTVSRIKTGEPTSLEAFADKHNLELMLRERPEWTGKARWEAQFKDVVVFKGDEGDQHLAGWGVTAEEAVDHYCGLLADRQIVRKDGLLGTGEKEVRCPENWSSTSFSSSDL